MGLDTEPARPDLDEAMSASAVEGLWRDEYGDMVQLAHALVDSAERAEEIGQEAFAQLLRRIEKVQLPGAYLRTAVVNGATSELRRREVRRRIYPRWSPSVTPAADEYLADALAGLTPKRRIVLVLRFYAGMADIEIAEHLGVRRATVRSLAARGLADLREVIDQ